MIMRDSHRTPIQGFIGMGDSFLVRCTGLGLERTVGAHGWDNAGQQKLS